MAGKGNYYFGECSKSFADDATSARNIWLKDQFLNSENDGNYGYTVKKPQKTSKSTKEVKIKPMLLEKMIVISETPRLNVFVEIMSAYDGFFEKIDNTKFSVKLMEVSMIIINKYLRLSFNEHKKMFLEKLKDSTNYLDNILIYLDEFQTNEKRGRDAIAQKKHRVPHTKKETYNIIDFLNNVKFLSKEWTNHFLTTPSFLTRLIQFLKGINHPAKYKHILPQIIDLQDRVTVIQAVESNSITYADNNNFMVSKPDIYPTLIELKSENRQFVKSKVNKPGNFNNLRDYLYTHMMLLREDFLIPLHRGIQQFLRRTNTKDVYNNDFLKIYPNVQILVKHNRYLTVDLQCKFSENDKKRFMSGSLLCFTSSILIDDLILAVIMQCDLTEGYIHIEILKTFNTTKILNHHFIMFQSNIYFEPYHNVYNVLWNVDHYQNIDIYAYFVNNKIAGAHIPIYLNPNPNSCIELNEKQNQALHYALYSDFSIIQGSPGTGKTFVGAKIVQKLLNNSNEQILILCHTNHGLDNMLINILKFNHDIVRMGNQSQVTQLDKYNYTQMKTQDSHKVKSILSKLEVKYEQLIKKFMNLQLKLCGSQHQNETMMDSDRNEKQLFDIQKDLLSTSRKIEEIKQISKYFNIKSKRIIGMTTTFAARNNTLLSLLKAPIVIVEEAAQILESHIFAAIHCTRNLILIGDHRQLPPIANICNVTGILLFERYINRNQRCVTILDEQHRMRPEISNLLRKAFYMDLIDGSSVLNYPDIIGITKNIFFIEHTELDITPETGTTKQNLFEANYLLGLSKYLVQQGYAERDITILTSYSGQVESLKGLRTNIYEIQNIKITTIDAFQGKENKIVLLSLVRSNVENEIGFLSLENRINVALSRATQGLYIVGNMSLFKNTDSPIWSRIYKHLKQANLISDRLCLKCVNHNAITQIKDPLSFQTLATHGGCSKKCEAILECGHKCNYSCHNIEGVQHYCDCCI